MKTIETKRLILREFIMDDVDDFYEYASVPGVGEHAGWPHHKSIETSIKILTDFIVRGTEYAIVYKENNKVIGSLGIYDKLDITIYENNNQKEIGYVLSKDYWGLGLMTEAVTEVIAFLFNDLNVFAIWCSHFDFNDKSKRVIEKCGFEFIKEEMTDVVQLSQKHISYVYCLSQKQYNMQAKRNKNE